MIRSSLRHHDPVYRDVIKHALINAWKGWRYWPLAFLASVLLTGSSYGFLVQSLSVVGKKSSLIGQKLPNIQTAFATISQGGNIVNATYALQIVFIIAILILAFFGLSVIAQGGLVFILGETRRGKKPTLREAFRVGGNAFWPLAVVNILAFAVIGILHFFVAFPLYLAITNPTQLMLTLYILSFIVFIPLIFLIVIIQIFSINAMILQGAPAAEAIIRSYNLFKKHWLTIFETAFILFFLTLGIFIIATGLIFVGVIPILVAVLIAAFIHSTFLFGTALGVGLAALIIGGFVVASFATQLQYATWTYLYQRLGEGGVVPKLHRWIRGLMESFSVPKS